MTAKKVPHDIHIVHNTILSLLFHPLTIKNRGLKTIMVRPLTTFAFLLSLLLLCFHHGEAVYNRNERCELHTNADPYYCDFDQWEILQVIMAKAGECTARELATPTIVAPRNGPARRNMISCSVCSWGCPHSDWLWCNICYSICHRRRNLRGTTITKSDGDGNEEEEKKKEARYDQELRGSSKRLVHAQRSEPIGEVDWETDYNMKKRRLSPNCKPAFQSKIANACIENMFVTHSLACSFKGDAYDSVEVATASETSPETVMSSEEVSEIFTMDKTAP